MLHKKIKISIGICTKDTHELLSKCLSSLELLKSVDLISEVIIADSSKDKTATQFVVGLSPLSKITKVLNVPELGISFARNMIFSSAKGDYLFSLDDDVTVSKDWLVAGMAVLSKYKNCGLVGGKVVAQNEIPKKFLNGIGKELQYKKNFWPFTLFDLGNKTKKLSKLTTTPSFANMVIRKDIYRNIFLDTRLANGTHGLNQIYGGEDPDFIEQAKKICDIYYCPEMEAFHFIKPYKFTRKYFIWRFWENGKERALFDIKFRKRKQRSVKQLLWLIKKLAKSLLLLKLSFAQLLDVVYSTSYLLTYKKYYSN